MMFNALTFLVFLPVAFGLWRFACGYDSRGKDWKTGLTCFPGFVTKVSKSEKSAFPRERKTAPLEVDVGGKKVFSLQWLSILQ